MSVGGIGRGGKSGGPKAASGAAKASGVFGNKVEKSGPLIGRPAAVGASNVGSVAAADPVTARVLELIGELKTGQLKSRDEATRKLVDDILRQKVRTQSKHLTEWIVDQLKDDPAKSRLLGQIWKRADEKE